jgi:hypothetical protein
MALPPNWMTKVISSVKDSNDAEAIAKAIFMSPRVQNAIRTAIAEYNEEDLKHQEQVAEGGGVFCGGSKADAIRAKVIEAIGELS